MKKVFAALAAAAVLVTAAAPSFATPMLRLSSGSSSVTVSDEATGDSYIGVEGVVTYIGSVGDFLLNVTTGMTKPAIGTATLPEMDLNSVDVSSSGGGILVIEFTETGFTNTSDALTFLTSIGGVVGGTSGSTDNLVFTVYVDEANNPFGTGTSIYSETFGAGAFAGSAFESVSFLDSVTLLPSSYSITLVAQLTHGGAGSTSFNGFVTVPEPATVALLGMGLLAAGLTRRRRTAQPSSTAASA